MKADQLHDDKIEDIIQSVRDLRDADFHVCKHSEWQAKGEPDTEEDITCTCGEFDACLLYTSPSPRDRTRSRMPSSA